MENNAFIDARFVDILAIMDARQIISVYEIGEDGKETLRFSNLPVYTFLGEENKGLFRKYEVVGIVAGLFTNVLIKKTKGGF